MQARLALLLSLTLASSVATSASAGIARLDQLEVSYGEFVDEFDDGAGADEGTRT